MNQLTDGGDEREGVEEGARERPTLAERVTFVEHGLAQSAHHLFLIVAHLHLCQMRPIISVENIQIFGDGPQSVDGGHGRLRQPAVRVVGTERRIHRCRFAFDGFARSLTCQAKRLI